MIGIKNVVLLSIAALAQIGSCTPTGQIEPPIPEVCNIAQHPTLSFTEQYIARSSCAKHYLDLGWPVSSFQRYWSAEQLLTCKSNYTGPSQSLTYNTVNECKAINWDTIGSIWLPDSKFRI